MLTLSAQDLSAVGLCLKLACGNEHLIAQIVPESARELGIEKGTTVMAAIKASAFKKIFNGPHKVQGRHILITAIGYDIRHQP